MELLVVKKFFEAEAEKNMALIARYSNPGTSIGVGKESDFVNILMEAISNYDKCLRSLETLDKLVNRSRELENQAIEKEAKMTAQPKKVKNLQKEILPV